MTKDQISAEVFYVVSFQKEKWTDWPDIKRLLFFQFNQILDSKAEIHQIFAFFFLFFFEKLRHRKFILKLTDL